MMGLSLVGLPRWSKVAAGGSVMALAVLALGGSPGRIAAQATYVPSVSQVCSPVLPVGPTATFSWPAAPGAIQQWLDLSLSNNGFAPGTFVSAGPLSPDTTSYTWQGLAPGLAHYYRLDILYPDGWHPSATGYFVSCEPGKAALGGVKPFCSLEGAVEATFNWSPATPAGTVQWLDLSLSDNGFVPGTFVSAGPLSGSASSFVWNGLLPGTTHYWRVNTFSPSLGWQSSASGVFATGCERVSTLPPPNAAGPVSAGGLARLVVGNDSPYELSLEMRGPQAYSFTVPPCGTCHVYSFIGPVLGCPAGIPEISQTVAPGNYTVNVSAIGHPEIATFVGQWTLQANSGSDSCFYVVERWVP